MLVLANETYGNTILNYSVAINKSKALALFPGIQMMQ